MKEKGKIGLKVIEKVARSHTQVFVKLKEIPSVRKKKRILHFVDLYISTIKKNLRYQLKNGGQIHICIYLHAHPYLSI